MVKGGGSSDACPCQSVTAGSRCSLTEGLSDVYDGSA